MGQKRPYNSQDMEATKVSIERWMDKGDVAHIYNGEKTASSISGARKTGQLHVKEWN